jgi:hypothetical protein
MRSSKNKNKLNPSELSHLVTLKKLYKFKIKTKKADYYSNLFTKCENTADTWKIINGLCNRSKKLIRPTELLNGACIKLTDDLDIANCFNNYFANIGTETIEKLSQEPEPEKICEELNELKNLRSDVPKFKFSTIDAIETLKTLKSMKVNMSDSLIMVPSSIIKLYGAYLSYPLNNIVNSSLITGVFPKSCKEGIILPIYKKKGSTNLVKNYRPITTTCLLGKLIEKVIKCQLDAYLLQLEYFGKEQFGFTKGLNTELTLANMVKHIHEIVDDGDLAVALFVDVEKAFDCVSHDVILCILKKTSI